MAELEEVDASKWIEAGRHDVLTKLLMESPFAGEIVITDPNKSVAVAQDEYNVIDLTNKLVFWTDASHKRSGIGIAFVWKQHHYNRLWETKQFFLEAGHAQGNDNHQHFDNQHGEFFAISEAMKLATQLCRQRAQRPGEDDADVSSVFIYTDSQAALLCIRDSHRRPIKFSRQIELARLKERADILVNDMGIRLELYWVKGHKAVEGNCLADKLAYRAADGPGPDIELIVPVTGGRFTVIENGQLRKKSKQKTMQRKSVIPNKQADSMDQVPARAERYERRNLKRLNPAMLTHDRRLKKLVKLRKISGLAYQTGTSQAGQEQMVLDDVGVEIVETVTNVQVSPREPILREDGHKMDRFMDLSMLT